MRCGSATPPKASGQVPATYLAKATPPIHRLVTTGTLSFRLSKYASNSGQFSISLRASRYLYRSVPIQASSVASASRLDTTQATTKGGGQSSALPASQLPSDGPATPSSLGLGWEPFTNLLPDPAANSNLSPMLTGEFDASMESLAFIDAGWDRIHDPVSETFCLLTRALLTLLRRPRSSLPTGWGRWPTRNSTLYRISSCTYWNDFER